MEFKYVKENEYYQSILDQVYDGKVKAVNKYVNPKATILHFCSDCGQTFFARPLFLVKKDNQKHVCNIKHSDRNPTKNTRHKLTREQKDMVFQLHLEGKSISEIARLFNVKTATIRYIFKKHNLI